MKARGFTLVEVLIATVLLAAGLALAFGTLRAATATAQRGEAMAARSEHMRAVAGFLRGRLVAARPLAFAFDVEATLPVRFTGRPDAMRFVADLPAWLGQGGPHVHDLRVVPRGDRVDLVVGLALLQPLDIDGAVTWEAGEPELLAEGLRSVRFRYRALDADGQLGEWQDSWETPERLPVHVEIAIRGADGRAWPPVVVALPLAGTITSAVGDAM